MASSNAPLHVRYEKCQLVQRLNSFYNMNLLIMCSIFPYQDPTNLQTKVQKHQNFEAELDANKNRIETIQQTGEQLIEEKHYASETIR